MYTPHIYKRKLSECILDDHPFGEERQENDSDVEGDLSEPIFSWHPRVTKYVSQPTISPISSSSPVNVFHEVICNEFFSDGEGPQFNDSPDGITHRKNSSTSNEKDLNIKTRGKTLFFIKLFTFIQKVFFSGACALKEGINRDPTI